MLEMMYTVDFPEQRPISAENVEGYSVEENKFLKLMDQESSSEVPLPFRDKDARLPNNRTVAEK